MARLRFELNSSRLIVGLILVAVAVLMLLFLEGDGHTGGAAGIGVMGLIGIATSRRKHIADLGSRPARKSADASSRLRETTRAAGAIL